MRYWRRMAMKNKSASNQWATSTVIKSHSTAVIARQYSTLNLSSYICLITFSLYCNTTISLKLQAQCIQVSMHKQDKLKIPALLRDEHWVWLEKHTKPRRRQHNTHTQSSLQRHDSLYLCQSTHTSSVIIPPPSLPARITFDFTSYHHSIQQILIASH